MTKERAAIIGLIAMQILAVLIYPPIFFTDAPQAIVLPVALLFLLVAALIAMNTNAFSPTAGKNSLVFVQGLNIVVRLMMLLPNLRRPNGNWDPLLLILQLAGMGLSWYTIIQLDKRPVGSLLLTRAAKTS